MLDCQNDEERLLPFGRVLVPCKLQTVVGRMVCGAADEHLLRTAETSSKLFRLSSIRRYSSMTIDYVEISSVENSFQHFEETTVIE